ncbi:hypothetical protein [Actinomadura madurae]|uniref:hypothetical protein n=1 Tax=Actinomadura madurae TaxID=1993 RepID=UPI0027E35BE8|nr:hypothetical protein [Actinomadura madurae]
MIIDRRFHGPEGSGNGGYVAGRLAGRVPIDTVTVTLRQPPPLETELTVTVEDERGHSARLWDGERLIAEALAGAIVVPPIAPVPFEDALVAAEKYRAAENHPFPGCFVCGPDRAPGDGLRLEPGPVGEGTVAAPWVPERTPERELVWAALDCPGGWSFDVARQAGGARHHDRAGHGRAGGGRAVRGDGSRAQPGGPQDARGDGAVRGGGQAARARRADLDRGRSRVVRALRSPGRPSGP